MKIMYLERKALGMEYITIILLGIPIFIIIQLVNLLLKRAKRVLRKYHSQQSRNNQLSKKQRWLRGIYRTKKSIAKHPVTSVSLAAFIILMVVENVAPNHLVSFINKYSVLRYVILIWFLYYAKKGSHHIRQLSKETNHKWFTVILVGLSLLSISPIWLSLLSGISNTIDFVLVVITILFCFLPLYYITVLLLDIIEHPLLRIIIGYLYSVLIAVYTALAIGIYNTKVEGGIVNFNTFNSIIKMIVDGITYMSQTSLKDIVMTKQEIRLDRIIQILIGGYGTLVIAYITKISSGPKEKL